MKIKFDERTIADVTKKVSKILSTKKPFEILDNVLVEGKEDCILFTATDGTDTIIHRVALDERTEVEEFGKALFPKEAFNTLKKIKGMITFELKSGQLFITSNKTKLQFSTMDCSEFPQIPDIPKSKPMMLPGKIFEGIVHKTTFAASKQETRPILQGVNIQINKDENVVVSTDSHRLSKVKLDQLDGYDDITLTVPASVLDQAVKSFDLEMDVVFIPSDKFLYLANGNTIYISRLLEGNYPETSRLIPTDFKVELVVARQELIDGLELMQTISDNNAVNLTVNGMFAEIKSTGAEKNGSREIAVEFYEGDEDFSINFSAQFAIEALQRIEGNSVRIRFTDAMKPIIAQSKDENITDIQLILPVRQY